MSIDTLLKKEGVIAVRKLNKKETNVIAKDIAIKLCLAFPEHNLNRNQLFNIFSSVNMYFAQMPKDFSGAKYVSQNNSIYFNQNLHFEDIPNVAMHECIHLIQDVNANKVSSYSFNSKLGFIEAAVQMMSAEANLATVSEVKYFDITIRTISPDYYPLECSLINQIAYFTGTFPLYHSILYGDDIFKNTFITKFNKPMYNFLIKNFNNLLYLENELSNLSLELSYASKLREVKSLNKLIRYKKQEIYAQFYKIQNYIIKKCFSYELNSVKNSDDLYEFKQMLYEYKNIIGFSDSYTFYNDFYCSAIESAELKKQQIEKFGEITLLAEECKALTVINTAKNSFTFMSIFANKIRKLFKVNVANIEINVAKQK